MTRKVIRKNCQNLVVKKWFHLVFYLL